VTARVVLSDAPPALFDSMEECGGWALNTYRKCDLRCVYCITGAQGGSVPRCSEDQLVPKLRAELDRIPDDAPIAVGAVVDAYPLAEAELGFTRRALAELAARHRPFNVITQGAAVLRDIDLFLEAPASVTVSLCSVDDRLLATVDPKAPGVEERLGMIRALDAAGVVVRVSAAPWIPGVSDAAALLDRVPSHLRVRFAPLNVVSMMVARTPYGRRFDQREINEAYLREFARVGPHPNAIWQWPVALDPDEDVPTPFACMPPELARSAPR
jgi:DNA repair photolyase